MNPSGQGRPWDASRWLHAIGVALIVIVLAGLVAKNVRLQWDFRTYRAAAQCALGGLDPYLLENLRAVSGRPIELPFLYLPAALVPFLPFAALPNAAALWVWIGLKSAIFIALVILWRRHFLPAIEWLVLGLVAVFGFNGAVLWDMRSGNVALVEVSLLWLAFASYVRHRRVAFGLLVVAAAIFKLMPIAFLALLLVPAEGQRPRPRLLAGLLMAFAIVTVVPTMVPPGAGWSGFATHAAAAFPAGDANPGALALAWALSSTADAGDAWRWALTIWGLYGIALIAMSMRWCIRTWRSGDAMNGVMGASMLYVLLSPRPMAYGYILVIPPLLYFTRGIPGGPAAQLAVALLVSAQGLARISNHPPVGALFDHTPFLMTLALWLAIALGGLRALSPQPAPAGRVTRDPLGT